MATKCNKCGGFIPDISYESKINICDCKNHIKPQMDFTNIKNLKTDTKVEYEQK